MRRLQCRITHKTGLDRDVVFTWIWDLDQLDQLAAGWDSGPIWLDVGEYRTDIEFHVIADKRA